jgi:hypothetical protein
VPATGLFGGSFVNTAVNKMPIFFTGELLQTNRFGGGLFFGTNETGFVTIEPVP